MIRILQVLALAQAALSLPELGSSTADARGAAVSKVFLTQEEALALAFPECTIERRTIYLDKARKARVAELAKIEFDQGVVYTYAARKSDKLVGTAYFDTHRVRALRESLMIVVAPDGTMQRLEVLSFAEPLEYLPRASWYAQFLKKRLDDELDLKRGIRGIAGATLTARATADAVRRVLAVHAVLGEGVGGLEARSAVAPLPEAGRD